MSKTDNTMISYTRFRERRDNQGITIEEYIQKHTDLLAEHWIEEKGLEEIRKEYPDITNLIKERDSLVEATRKSREEEELLMPDQITNRTKFERTRDRKLRDRLSDIEMSLVFRFADIGLLYTAEYLV